MENNPLLQALFTRRSTRAYTQQPVSHGLLEQITQAACHAPSASNQQKWRFTVVTNPEKLACLTNAARVAVEASGRDVPDDYCCTYHAPALILVSFPRDYRFLKEDGACALQNIFLASHALGLGSCWINQFGPNSDHPQVRAALDQVGIPADHLICGCAAIGHIAQETSLRPRAENTVHFVP